MSGEAEVSSLEELFEANSGPVFGYLLRLSGNPSLAEELTQETFFRAMLALDSFRGDASVKTWLLRIARNLYLRHARRDRRLVSLEGMTDRGVALSAPGPGPETQVANQERDDRLYQALLRLSEDDRSILLLFYQAELPQREIAQVLDISVVAVKVRLYRARQRLAAILKPQLGEAANDS